MAQILERRKNEKALYVTQSALKEFSAVVDFRGGKLDEKYEELKTELDRSESKAEAVRKRVTSVEDVATALFDEWARDE